MQLDHLVVAGETLEEAVAHVEDALGVAMGPGGEHSRFGTHNRLLGLADGIYLEAIAINPDATPQNTPRWFGLDEFRGAPRLITWAARVSDLSDALATYPLAGNCIDMQRGDLRWRMSVASDGGLPLNGAFPSLLEWQVTPIPSDLLPASGCALKRLSVTSPMAASHFPTVSAKPQIEFTLGGELRLDALFQTPKGERVLA
ncbi:VOC family protein [Cognatishimia activa]|uniref:VOC family protein n=1 Tax=Cognatishimia activa TaxID=1715691 RepID=UPI00222F657D|nr:VOC family protein [Cognatishimia activa]UZD92501.1 VOC family protein [Cognatishimia activa]